MKFCSTVVYTANEHRSRIGLVVSCIGTCFFKENVDHEKKKCILLPFLISYRCP